MKENRSIKNLVYSIASQVIVLALGLIVPRILLKSYGSDTNGLLSTVTQIMTYMALLEAGIGQATRNELYHYIHGKVYDRENICQVMSVSRKSFRDITRFYALAVLIFALTTPFIIKTDLDYKTVFFVVLLEGATGVISFYFIQNWKNLLMVDGRQYVNANIDLVNKILSYSVKIVLARTGVNIIYMELGFFLVSIIRLFIYKIYMNAKYGWIKYNNNTGNRKLKDRGSFIVTEIAWTVFSSTDMIVLSIFCSTKDASVYSVYNMVFVAINHLLNAVYTGLKFNLGQTYHDNVEKYKDVHDLFNSLVLGAMSAAMSVTYFLCIPFVRLYTSGINDINYINYALPIGFCLVQLLSWSRMIAGNLSGLAGYAKQVSKISMIEAITNIVLSVILVNRFGIAGVLFATVFALPVKLVYCNWLADRVILKRSPFKTIRILAVNIGLFLVLVFIRNHIDFEVKSYGMFVKYGILFTVCSVLLFSVANVLANRKIYTTLKTIMRRFNARKAR